MHIFETAPSHLKLLESNIFETASSLGTGVTKLNIKMKAYKSEINTCTVQNTNFMQASTSTSSAGKQ